MSCDAKTSVNCKVEGAMVLEIIHSRDVSASPKASDWAVCPHRQDYSSSRHFHHTPPRSSCQEPKQGNSPVTTGSCGYSPTRSLDLVGLCFYNGMERNGILFDFLFLNMLSYPI